MIHPRLRTGIPITGILIIIILVIKWCFVLPRSMFQPFDVCIGILWGLTMGSLSEEISYQLISAKVIFGSQGSLSLSSLPLSSPKKSPSLFSFAIKIFPVSGYTASRSFGHEDPHLITKTDCLSSPLPHFAFAFATCKETLTPTQS
jgi:hypothetical protein